MSISSFSTSTLSKYKRTCTGDFVESLPGFLNMDLRSFEIVEAGILVKEIIILKEPV